MRTILATLILLSATQAAAQEGAIAALTYRGVGFAATSQELLAAVPTARLGDDHVGERIATYEVWDDQSNDCVLLRFVDDALIEIDFIYFPHRVESNGGMAAMRSRSIERFGAPTTQTDQTLLWDFPAIDRMVIAFSANRKWSLHVYHRSRRLAMTDYKDTTVTVKRPPTLVTEGRNGLSEFDAKRRNVFDALGYSLTPWYEGGTLHEANVAEWKMATASNKLATAAAWLSATTWRDHLNSHPNFDGLWYPAQRLVTAVDGAVIDLTSDDLGGVIKVQEVANPIISVSNDLGPPILVPAGRPYIPARALRPHSNRDATLTHWLNTDSYVRHNSGCRFYRNTLQGRACAAGEGKACGTCGG